MIVVQSRYVAKVWNSVLLRKIHFSYTFLEYLAIHFPVYLSNPEFPNAPQVPEYEMQLLRHVIRRN